MTRKTLFSMLTVTETNLIQKEGFKIVHCTSGRPETEICPSGPESLESTKCSCSTNPTGSSGSQCPGTGRVSGTTKRDTREEVPGRPIPNARFIVVD